MFLGPSGSMKRSPHCQHFVIFSATRKSPVFGHFDCEQRWKEYNDAWLQSFA
jgi:hypothetical protein